MTDKNIQGLVESLEELLQYVKEIKDEGAMAAYSKAKAELLQLSEPKVKWRNYPEEKPRDAHKVFTDNFTFLTFYKKNSKKVISNLMENNKEGFFNIHWSEKTDIKFWCYESDLLATLPKTEDK